MEVEFGASVALCYPAKEYEYILEDSLEEGLKRSALRQTQDNNNNAISHPVEKATTNVVCIKFSDANMNQPMSTGDPIACSECKAIMNYKSVVNNSSTWGCEFCDNQNQLQMPIDADEVPTSPVTEYLLEPPSNKTDEQAVIFCLDASGSMNGARMETLQRSMDDQLVQLAKTRPDARVGLIIFGSSVIFFSGVDDSREFRVDNTNNDLESFELLTNISRECKALGKIKDTVGALRAKVRNIRDEGSTALGPALVMGVCVAGAAGAGSQVVTCTDGQANVGVGSMSYRQPTEGSDPCSAFFAKLASTAKQNGVSVSVMSFSGTDVNLEKLAVLADSTGGKVKITDLGKLSRSFKNVVEDTVVAWAVEVTRITSRNVLINPEDVKADLGNCVKNSEVTSEFTVIPAAEAPEALFQTQVRYTRVADGARMLKVFTHALPVVKARADAEGSANLAILALHAVRMCAKRAQEGVYTHARLGIFAQQRMLARIAQAQDKHQDYLRFLEDLEVIDGECRYAERQEEKSGRRERGDRDLDRDRDRRDDRRDRRDDRGANVFYQMKAWNSRNMRRSRSRSPPRQRHRSRSPEASPPTNTTTTTTVSCNRSRSRSPPRRRRSPSPRRDRERDVDWRSDRRDRDRDRDRKDTRDRR